MAAATIIEKRFILSSEITYKYTQINSYTYRFMIEGTIAVLRLKSKALIIRLIRKFIAAKVRQADYANR
jgi:hypothetical protein